MTSTDHMPIQIEETDDKIELEKLKEHEKIFFYDDVTLFEDELADNGCAVMNVKVRVMASGFFILLRFFLRVDGVLARLHETRIYHQAGSESMLREFTKREGSFAEMKVICNLSGVFMLHCVFTCPCIGSSQCSH
jgi:type 2A phosphatase activator TIP41